MNYLIQMRDIPVWIRDVFTGHRTENKNNHDP